MNYDPQLAQDLGADEYGMKSYFFVLLKRGNTKVEDEAKRAELFKGHMDNIIRLEDAGKIIVAGPFGENNAGFAGIFIMDVADENEAHSLLSADPTIAKGIFTVEIYPWYGSAALGAYMETHAKIAKKNVI